MKIIKVAGVFITGMAIMALSVPLITGCAMEEYTITSQTSSTSSGGTSTSSGGGGEEVLYDDFEDGDLVNSLAGGSIDMWKDAGGDAAAINSSGDAHGGSRSMLIWISRPGSSAGAAVNLVRSSDWSASNTYDTVRAWIKAKGTTGSFLCMARETTDNEWSHANFDSSDSWQQIETSSSTFGLKYILFSVQSLTTASLYVDDVTVSNSASGGTSTGTSSGTSTGTSSGTSTSTSSVTSTSTSSVTSTSTSTGTSTSTSVTPTDADDTDTGIVYDSYMPDLTIDWNKVIYTSPGSLKSDISNAGSGYTVIASDGDYYPGNISINSEKHITIRAANIYGVKFHGGFTISGSYVNIIGFDASGYTGGEQEFLRVTGGHHIYMGQCSVHDQDSTIYSHADTHDITVDQCSFYRISRNYAWYALGWHQTIQNSLMYEINNHYFAVRGHYSPEHGGPDLAMDDWTHKVINNTFGYQGSYTARGRHAAIVIYYAPSDGGGEQNYDPPRNILIENNLMVNLYSDFAIYPIAEGFNDAPRPIIGTVIRNNVTNEAHLFKQQESWEQPNEGTIATSNNKDGTSDPGILDSDLGLQDPDNLDYTPTAQSQYLVDQSGVFQEILKDLNGNDRIARPDIGALEYLP